jgi:hypothetical protein
VTEAPPTSDQLKNILEYLGGSPGKVVQGASDETDAMRRLKADGNTFIRPLVVDWNQGKAGKFEITAITRYLVYGANGSSCWRERV